MKKKGIFPVVLLLSLCIIFFFPVIRSTFPIPADTIVGLYNPYRDLFAKQFPRGVPFINSLITDPVRQQYPWRSLSIDLEKHGELPLWNPYTFSGTPLLANFQSAVFYPLNVFFFLFPFAHAWTMLVISQILLAALFVYGYLENLELDKRASFLGAFAFAFSGVSIAWLEWGTIVSTGLWLPLILLSIDKISNPSISSSFFSSRFCWCIILCIALVVSFFAGHLQTFFYLSLVSLFYFFARWIQLGKDMSVILTGAIVAVAFLLITGIQWFSTLQFILSSARGVDQITNITSPGWFIPWMHLVQFIIPDFFGNPATGNYWGVWNYGELVGYIGIVPLIFAICALFSRKDFATKFYGGLVFLSLLFALPTFIAHLPFILHISFLSTAQPTRLLFITDFSLAVLAGLGMDYYVKNKKNSLFYILSFFMVCFLVVGFTIMEGSKFFSGVTGENILVAKHNLYIPVAIFLAAVGLLAVNKVTKERLLESIIPLLIFLTIIDLFRFGYKFAPFTKPVYLYPTTKTISFLQKNIDNYRYMTTDSRLMAPNFSVIHKLQSVDGYDPLYLQRYAEFIAALEREKPDIQSPFGFNRIITPHTTTSPLINLLGVKYVLSLSDINSSQFKKVFEEGETKVYENQTVFPRAFFVSHLYPESNAQQTIKKIYDKTISLRTSAVIEDSPISSPITFSGLGEVLLTSYTPNKIILQTQNGNDGFLVLTDSYYPTWKAKIVDNTTTQDIEIYRTDYAFRGVFVPKGNHTIIFYDSIF